MIDDFVKLMCWRKLDGRISICMEHTKLRRGRYLNDTVKIQNITRDTYYKKNTFLHLNDEFITNICIKYKRILWTTNKNENMQHVNIAYVKVQQNTQWCRRNKARSTMSNLNRTQTDDPYDSSFKTQGLRITWK